MTLVPPDGLQVQLFRDLVAARLGLVLENETHQHLAEVISTRARQLKLPSHVYLRRLAEDPQETRELARWLTVTETYFFRHLEQMLAFRELALPERLKARGHLPVRIASVGCASGEEPYSLAMLALSGGVNPSRLQITGLDVNPDGLEKARLGRYSPWSLRETPADMRRLWFQERNRQFLLDPRVKNTVVFSEANLADPSCSAWSAEGFDIIFCRNLLMYFSPPTACEAMKRLYGALAPGGYLFLGHAENLRGAWLGDFELQSRRNSFFYRKPMPEVADTNTQASMALVKAEASALQAQQTAQSSTVHAVPVERTLQADWSAPPSNGLTAVRRQIERERYEQARTALFDANGNLSQDAEALLLLALVCVHLGDYDQAELACRQDQRARGDSASTSYLLGLCQEGRHDLTQAIKWHRQSVHLDPEFAMPRVHLALLAQRRGDLAAARREFEMARLLLHHEAPERLRLFGAGFGREGLLGLCVNQIGVLEQSLGGAS